VAKRSKEMQSRRWIDTTANIKACFLDSVREKPREVDAADKGRV
jgi:hypothetical protein